MKLRYYLRGLAVGILLTTIVLTIANRDNRPMTDAQIRQRALELGMVESDSLKLSDVAIVETSTEEKQSEESQTKESTPETSTESTEESAESKVESLDTGTSASSQETEPSLPAGETVTFVIKSGDSSYTVSKALASIGLVEDAVDFDNFLCNNGYSRTIRTGTYQLVPGMSYEEIAKSIAR